MCTCLKGDAMNEDTVRRFWEKVQKTPDCWLWTASRRRDGYGQFRVSGGGEKNVVLSAHRISYELLVGPIPDGLCVLHKCDNPICVNPEHLFPGTMKDNVDDMMRKGRHVKAGTYTEAARRFGEDNLRSKLTSGIVREIRSSYQAGGISMQKIADAYGVQLSCISKIVNRKRWPHVE